ncbi:MAG: endonuclease/exonuclease/phosphatase family protein [Leptolyngbyaceae cyanobacterium]
MKLLSYNTHLFLDSAPSFAKQDLLYNDEIRLQHIAQKLVSGDFDIVGLCEVWADKSKDTLIGAVKQVLPYAYYQPYAFESQPPAAVGSGLLVLSKYPVDGRFNAFGSSNLCDSDRYSNKGFYFCRISFNDNLVQLFFTHTQANGDGKVPCRDLSTDTPPCCRKRNLSKLCKYIEGSVDKNQPVIIMGDLNLVGDCPGDSEYEDVMSLFKQLGVDDQYRHYFPTVSMAPGVTYDAAANSLISRFAPEDAQNHIKQRLDYIFTNAASLEATVSQVEVLSDFRYEDKQNKDSMADLSDHYPLSATVSF